jgi:hypothetical protein
VKADAFSPTDAERGKTVIVLQPPELAFHGSAASVQIAPPLSVARDARKNRPPRAKLEDVGAFVGACLPRREGSGAS